MIVEWFLDFIMGTVVSVFDAILPDVANGIPALGSVFEGVATLNAFLPVTETLGVAAFLLLVQGVMFLVKITQTVVAHIPWVGGAGG